VVQSRRRIDTISDFLRFRSGYRDNPQLAQLHSRFGLLGQSDYHPPLAPPVDGFGAGAAASGDECPSEPGPFDWIRPARLIAASARLTTSINDDPALISSASLPSPVTVRKR
jgi:hypothetical protein